MLLKKLELIGFKSFADKTEFVFESGVTALVGPNGCGKSNVVDAVKWILGEQSVKSLRGTEMADIIFNGGAKRKSLGFAEATLTFDNTDRRLALDFDEVTITRRVYRSGEGAYFINKQACRLKDIKNLLLDTGLGMQAYSVIEQGKIDRILVTSAVERRKVFDEAAGISKYKTRRKEAENKLERVEQNVLRLDDVIGEVKKQLRRVKYQAAKARKFSQYKEELGRLRMSYSLKEFDGLSKQRRETGERLGGLEEERTGLITKRDRTDAARSDCEMRVLDFEHTQESAHSVLAELRQKILLAEDAVRYNRTRIAEQGELQERYERQMTELETRVTRMHAELEEQEGESEELGHRLHDEQQSLERRVEDLSRMNDEERVLAGNVRENKDAVVEVMQRASRLENELGVVQSDRRRLAAQQQRQAGRLSEVTAELDINSQSVHRAEEEIAEVDSRIRNLAGQMTGKQSENRELGRRLAGLREELAAGRERQSGLQSRLDVLRDLDEKQEGVEQGVREVLAQLTEAGAGTAGLHGMLGEKLTVEERYSRAVEAALGHRAQTLVVDELRHAMEGVRLVKASGKGRASFLPLSHCKVKGNGHVLPAGTVGRLAEFVVCEERHRLVVDALLGNVLLVENMPSAVEMNAVGTNGFVLVTLAGEVMEPTGIITGGDGVSGGGLIRRAAERRSLEDQLEQLHAEVVRFEERLRLSQQTEAAIDEEIERLAGMVETERAERGVKAGAVERLREKQRLLGDERGVIVSEQEELVRESAELDERQGALRVRLDETTCDREELELRISALTHSQSELNAGRLAVQEEMTELRVTIARSREQADGLRSAIDSLSANLRIRRDELEQLRAGISEAKRKQTDAREEIARRETELEDLRRREHDQQRVVLELTNSREGLREEMTALEKTSREIKGRLTELDEVVGQLRLEVQEVGLRMETLVARVREDFDLDLGTVYETWEPEDMNWEEVAARIEELRRKVDNMGSVDLEAIQDEEALSRRAAFLDSQRDDLMEAKRHLEQIIHRLNKESLEMFERSFAEVRENFQEMFRKLFGGGKADLFLEDEQNILESGIEIIARPPGKKPQSLSLLSGGEKVMTAVALLFAMFKAKPSPFCLLDEVDAALDEANIGRFANILQDFLKHSQFVIITHSKRTMAIANVIYGITMQESGVSKKISVKFEDYEEQVA